MFGHTGEIFFRSLFSFSLLFLLTRWMGRKQMAQLTYFDYITGITVGSMAASLVVERDVQFSTGFLGLTFWSIFTVLLNILILHSRKARKILDGVPCLVISNGQILEKNMNKMRYTFDDLNEELREKDIFSISDVQFAVLETDGMLSIQLKPEKRTVVKRDLQIPVSNQSMPVELVMDGKILVQNLIQNKLSEEWLLNEFSKRNILDLSDITYACLDSNQQIYIDLKKDSSPQTFKITH